MEAPLLPHDADTGLVHLGAREYDPETGAFTRRDPSGLEGGENQYAYAGGDPVNYWDPDGNFVAAVVVGAAAGAAIGGAEGAVFGAADEVLDQAFDPGRTGFDCGAIRAAAKRGAAAGAAAGAVAGGIGAAASGGGRGKNRLAPDPSAQGPHSTFKRDPNGGKVTGHAEWQPNPRNPSGFDQAKRVDTQYGSSHSHGGTATPHVHEGGRIRPANPDELPP